MKLLPTLVLALTAAASCAVSAATYGSDQERRDQNREEALTKWRADHGDLASRSSAAAPRESLRERTREKTHKAAQGTRHFTHRQAEKVRNFGDRQDRKFDKRRNKINTSPEGGK